LAQRWGGFGARGDVDCAISPLRLSRSANATPAMPPPSLDRSSLREKQSEFIWPPIKTAGLWSLKINCDNSVGAGFSPPIAPVTDRGGGKPPLPRIAPLQ